MIRVFLCILFLMAGVLQIQASQALDEVYGQQLLVISPVVDCFYSPFLEKDPPASYSSNSGLASFKQYRKKCRSHQLLFNEVVTLVSQNNSLLEVALNDAIYGEDPITQKPKNTVWIDAKYVLPVRNLEWEEIDGIPILRKDDRSTLVLTLPWDRFSFATRFVRSPDYDTTTEYAVVFIDPSTFKLMIRKVPKTHARIQGDLSFCEKKRLLVDIACQLVDHAQQQGGIVPYVLGGSSYVTAYPDDLFFLRQGVWERVGPNSPYAGFDCSELILRLTQVCDIFCPYKTTDMLRKKLVCLSENDAIEEGDLIWVKGHIMLISKKSCCEIIEARGYDSGYGRLHISFLSKCFQNIQTLEDLKLAYDLRQKITLLDALGNPSLIHTEFLLLKFTDYSASL